MKASQCYNVPCHTSRFMCHTLWCHGVVVITTAQLHLTKPELTFCAGSNPACDVSEIHNGENLR